MSKVNRIFILFLCFLMVTIISIWQLLQSEFFAQIAVGKINQILEKKQIALSADFKNAEFHLFPPGISLNGVDVFYKKGEMQLELHYSKIMAEINPFEAMRRLDEVDHVIVSDGSVILNLPESKNDEVDENKDDLRFELPNINKLIAELPFKLNELTLEETSLKANQDSVYVKNLNITTRDELSVKLDVSAINLKALEPIKVDNVVLNANLNEYELKIKNLEVKKGLSHLKTSLEINLNKDLLLSEIVKGKYKLESPLSSIHDYAEFKNIGELRSGDISLEGSVVGFLDSFKFNNRILVKNFETSFVNGEKLDLNVYIDNQQIKIEEANLYTENGYLTLLSPFEFFNFKSSKFVEDPVNARVENIDLNNALTYLGTSLEPLKGHVFGNVTFILNENDFHFLVSRGSKVKNVGLQIGETNIIRFPELKFDFAQFDIFGTDFRMTVAGTSNKSRINVSGEIASGFVDIQTKNSLIDFSEVKEIAGIGIDGFGEVAINVEGPLENVQMDIETKLQNFTFFDIKQQKQYSKLLFYLGEGRIVIDEFVGENFNSKLTGYGTVDYENKFVDLNVKSDEITFLEVIRSFPLFTGPLVPYQNDFEALMKVDAHVFGGFSLEHIKVDANVTGTNVVAYDESFDFVETKIALSKGDLLFNNVKILKGDGNISGSAIINLINQDIDWETTIDSIATSDLTLMERLPLSISGNINGYSQGHIGKNSIVDAEINLEETKFESESLEDSHIKFTFKDNEGDFNIDLLNKRLVLKADLERTLSGKINADVETILNSDVEDIMKIVSGIDTYNFPLTGNVESTLRVEVKESDYLNANIFLNLKELNLYRKDLKLEYKDPEPEFIVKSGNIEKWNLRAVGNKVTILSKGSGNLYNEHLIEGRNKIDAEILEIFSEFISRASGVLNMSYEHKGSGGGDQQYELHFSGDEVAISSDKLPIPIKRMNFKINAKDLGFDIEKFNIEFPSGFASVGGRVDFKSFAPDINLDLNLSNVNVPIIKRAQVSVDGDLNLVGKKPPYLFSGDVKIIRGDVFTELADLESDGNFSRPDYQYLPKRNQIKEVNFLNFNVNVTTLNPIRVNNSLARINLNADLQVTGGEKKPILTGRIYPTAGEKKLFFKGNEFLVNKANVVFSPNEELTNPEVDFFAVTSITDYKINVEAFGNVKDLNMRMSSDPYLSQEDILSLVAFGYTDDISNNLSSDDKESITRAGVGALIFDSLKINETLKNEFGLQVNLGTEITQDEGSYLSGRTEGGTGASRVRTATKVQVTKQLNDEINLSVSSTVGGSVGQRQSMNLNYNLTNKVSVEGVYEMNTRNEGEEDNIENSAGADLKFRWTFK